MQVNTVLFNNNIRCIEIVLNSPTAITTAMFNNNIRCIEMRSKFDMSHTIKSLITT